MRIRTATTVLIKTLAMKNFVGMAVIVGLGAMTPQWAKAQTFNDVPTDYWAYSFIETLANSGITTGCGNNNYCPTAPVTRAQMAVFLERGIRGSNYVPGPGVGNIFQDVPASYWAGGWVELLYSDGITTGCGVGDYCPEAAVTREQMAAFLLRAKYGQGYAPPTPTGVFNDVVLSHWAAPWIEQLAAEGITTGCGPNIYCPKDSVTRAQMAVFLVRAFNLNGGGGPPAVTKNLSSGTLAVTSPDPRIGYPLQVALSIEANEATDNVSIGFFVIDKGVPQSEVRELPIGTKTIGLVRSGTSLYDLTLDIPASISIPGSYYIGAVIDPVNVFEETNEEDNEALAEVTLAAIAPPELPADAVPVNIFIDKVELDRSLLSLKPLEYEQGLGVQNSDAGGTLFLGAQGSEVPIETEAFARLRLTRSDKQGATHDVPLYLWNSDVQNYNDAFGVVTGTEEWFPIGEIEPQLINIDQAADQPVYNDPDRKGVHLDLYLPGRLAQELDASIRLLNVFLSDPLFPPPDLTTEEINSLRAFLNNLPHSSDPENENDPGPALEVLSADICVEIRPVSSGIETVADRFAEDNQVCTPVTFVFPPLPAPRPDPIYPPPQVLPPLYSKTINKVHFNKFFRDTFGGNYIGIGLNFNAESSVDENGFIATASGEVPINVFGVPVQFMDARGRLQLIPAYKDAPLDQASELSFVLSFAGQQIFNRTASIDIGVSFSGELIPVPLFEQEKKVTRTFYPGGVPVTIEGSIGGTIGAKYTLEYQVNALPLNASLTLAADTFATLRAKASALAGVGAFVNIGAILDIKELLGEHYIVATGADLDTRRDGFQDGIVEIVFTPRFDIRNEINAGAGTFTVWAEFPIPVGVKFCGYWHIPCGLRYRQIKEDIVLDRFTAFRKADRLVNETADIGVVIYPDGTVAYYGP